MALTLTSAIFRTTLPEFANPVEFPDAQITSWIGIISNMINVSRWASLANLGASLLVAHNLTLGARDQAAALAGGAPGELTGAVSAKGIDKVSVSYDTAAAAMPDAGDLALTSYGIRYLRLARQVGAGGTQL